nr:GNAT family protein [uncultured Anaerosporobacter sp.]
MLSMLISDLFKDLGYKKIVLETNLNNLRAQHVYEKLGFQKLRVNVDAWKNQLGELQSSIDYELMEKDFIYYSE